MNLRKYSGNRVKITDIEGDTFTGLVDLYTSEANNPDGVETLSIWQDGTKNLIEFEKGEIAKIELISAVAPVMAEAV